MRKISEALTPCEVAVLKLVAEGYTNDQIALHLNKSSRTVNSQLRTIFQKAGYANSRIGAIRAFFDFVPKPEFVELLK